MKRLIIIGVVMTLALVFAYTPAASAQPTTYTETLTTNEDGVFHHGNYHGTWQSDGTRLDVQHSVEDNLPVSPDVTILRDNDLNLRNTMTGNGEVYHLTWKETVDNQGVISELRVVQTNLNGETIVQNTWVDGEKV